MNGILRFRERPIAVVLHRIGDGSSSRSDVTTVANALRGLTSGESALAPGREDRRPGSARSCLDSGHDCAVRAARSSHLPLEH
jgi:hypothetical protein